MVLALLLLAPLLGRGTVFARDMVFVPHAALSSRLLGLDGVPRAVPSDLLVALAGRLVPVGLLQDLVLVSVVVLAAWGTGRLVPTSSRWGTVAAAAAYGWSPYLHERLLLGQWALLVGWAVLPWAAAAALSWRRGGPGWPAVAWLAAASLGGASALLVVALVVLTCAPLVRAGVSTLVLSLPWALPALLQPLPAGDPRGVAAFAAHADTRLGVLGSLLTGGGTWARASWPPGRSAGSAVAAALLVLGVLGLGMLRSRLGNRLLVGGAFGLLLALLGQVPHVLPWLVVHVPATGLLRDGQKWVAPLVLVLACALGLCAERLGGWSRWLPVLVAVAPLCALPAAAWGESGRLRASHLPAGWTEVVSRARGPVVVLPWSLYKAYPWDGDRTVLDPATKLLARPVVNDELPLAHGSVAGEDPLAARLAPVVTTGGPLLDAARREGVVGVLVESDARGYDAVSTKRQLDGLRLVKHAPGLALYSVPGSRPRPEPGAPLWPVATADLAAAAFALLALRRATAPARS